MATKSLFSNVVVTAKCAAFICIMRGSSSLHPSNSTTGTYVTGSFKPNDYSTLPTVETNEETAATKPKQNGIHLFISVIKTVFLCSLFMIVGPALILLNKHIMTVLHFPYPLFLSGLGIAFSSLVASFIVHSGYVKLERREEVAGSLFYRRVLPVGVAYAGTLATGNMVYLLLDVGLIQMLKSFTPVVVMGLLFLTGIETPNRPVIISIIVISFGTAMTCSYTPNANVLGMAVMLTSEVFEAVRLVLTQFLLKDVKMGIVEGKISFMICSRILDAFLTLLIYVCGSH